MECVEDDLATLEHRATSARSEIVATDGPNIETIMAFKASEAQRLTNPVYKRAATPRCASRALWSAPQLLHHQKYLFHGRLSAGADFSGFLGHLLFGHMCQCRQALTPDFCCSAQLRSLRQRPAASVSVLRRYELGDHAFGWDQGLAPSTRQGLKQGPENWNP